MFETTQASITETVNAGKEKIQGDAAWELLGSAKQIVVGRGKKFSVFTPDNINKEEILKQCLGRTGNLRAPTLRIGETLVVGFCEDMYAQYVDTAQ